MSRLPDWIIVGQECWAAIARRNQLLIRALAGRNPGARFLFCEQPLRPSELYRWRLPRPRQVADNIWALRAVRPLPDSVSTGVSNRLECSQIRRAAKALGLERPYLWTQDPRAAMLVDDLPNAGVVYDLTDDWAAFEHDANRRAMVQGRIEALGRQADLVLACSRHLELGARSWTDRVRYLPNAVDPPSDPGPVPADLAAIACPRLGYAGTLHSSRLDVNLLARAAQLRPDWSFVFLGPDMLEPPDRERLDALPNTHLLGPCPHAEVRSYLGGFDVCLLPNLVNDFTRSLDPLKIYEYLAAGRPVVATPAGIPPGFTSAVTMVADAAELVDAAQHLLDDDSIAAADRRRTLIADATWDARAETLEQALGVASPHDPEPGVSVVIVSFNTRDLLRRCLTDLRSQDDVSLQTIVIDNASSDGSQEMVRTQFPEVELRALDENVGFARANNLAFPECRHEYVLLLNSDAFLASGSISELLATAERHPRAATIGARLLNPDGTLQRSAWPFPTAGRLLLEAFGLHRPLRRLGLLEDLGTWAHDEERSVDFLIGACLLLRSAALKEVGGFDEEFWLYGEEADLQRRLTARGWEVVFAPAAQAIHVASASSTDSKRRLQNFYAGQMRYLRKHSGPLAWPLARGALISGSLLRRRWSAFAVGLTLRALPPGRTNRPYPPL